MRKVLRSDPEQKPYRPPQPMLKICDTCGRMILDPFEPVSPVVGEPHRCETEPTLARQILDAAPHDWTQQQA